MIESLIKVLIFGLAFWVLFVMPARIILPYIIGKQLSYNFPRIQMAINSLPFYATERKADFIESTLKIKKHAEYMKAQYPVTLAWYQRLHGLWFKVILCLFVLGLIAQIIGVTKFALDPRGELDKFRQKANQIQQKK